ncbi:MAG: hypothetical protein JJE30_05620 [Desulfuromonadales bacterium]|nr:hypothetical protein [Desulfuromonadales bacterium]
MNAWLLKKLKSFAAFTLLISGFIVTSALAAQAEALILFLSPESTFPSPVGSPRPIQQKNLLKIDEKGDLLIQYGSARFTVAYNEPADQLKPSEKQQNPQREHAASINGISLTARLSF